MTNKRLKLLIAVMVIIIVFILGYNQGHTEDIIIEMQELTPVETGAVNAELTGAVEEQVIYTWEDTEKRLAEQVNELVGNYDISYTIVHECASKVEDYKKCIQDVVGVSNAESSIFKKGMYPSNNGFGLMQKTKNGYIKRKFSSIEESIKYRVNLYSEKEWYKRTTSQARLDGKYCTSECSGRKKNYSSAIKKLELD